MNAQPTLCQQRMKRRVSLMVIFSLLAALCGWGVNPSSASAAMSTKQVQYNLAALAYMNYSQVDGRTGPRTRGAIALFQSDRCLDADAIVGRNTEAALTGLVKKIQKKVGVTADGLAGPNTKAAIIRWQKRNRLSADGLAGPTTMRKMGIARQSRCGNNRNNIYGNSLSDSTRVDCYPGTKSRGTHTAYRNNKPYKVRLCEILGFQSSGQESNRGTRYYVNGAKGGVLVSSRVSGAAFNMFQRARRDGLEMSAISSFRTYAHQQALWDSSRNPAFVARPGYSGHQSAVAIDFVGPRAKNARAACPNPVTSTSSTYRWLRRNARNYGYKQYAVESWHWDTFPNATRC